MRRRNPETGRADVDGDVAHLPVPPEVLRLVEAFVFASPDPVTADGLRRLLPELFDPVAVLDALRRQREGMGVVLVAAGDGWTLRTAPDLAEALRPVLAEARPLPRAATETLAAVALHQPVTRTEIERVRGVALNQATMDVLLEAGLIQPVGRKDAAGRPTLWATTPRFLERFGLRSLRDLPGSDVVEAGLVGSPEDGGGDDGP